MKQNIKYYNESIKHFIDLSTKDATANIAKEHGIIGLTRLNICMEKLDLDISNNFFIALPDFTYTRNALRWNAGFPYGCIINIGLYHLYQLIFDQIVVVLFLQKSQIRITILNKSKKNI